MIEEWLPVAGFDGIYEVSSLGRVKRVGGGAGARRGVVLKPDVGRRGYMRVVLWRGGATQRFLVHRLVAAHFSGPSEMQVNHKDGDKSNNAAANLEYVSALENIRHAVDTGLRDTAGTANAQAKLDDDKVRAIRNSEASSYRLAKDYGVTARVIHLVRKGLSWRHVV